MIITIYNINYISSLRLESAPVVLSSLSLPQFASFSGPSRPLSRRFILSFVILSFSRATLAPAGLTNYLRAYARLFLTPIPLSRPTPPLFLSCPRASLAAGPRARVYTRVYVFK